MRVPGKPWHEVTVIHPPAVPALEIAAYVAAREGGFWPERGVASRVGIVMVHTEEEGIEGPPGRGAEGEHIEHTYQGSQRADGLGRGLRRCQPLSGLLRSLTRTTAGKSQTETNGG